MAYILPELGFEYDALEPYFDAKTMEIHHLKHHAGYLQRFNEAIKDTILEHETPVNIFAQISKFPEAVRNNGGGFYNHALFWKMLTPYVKSEIDVVLRDAITKYFGTFDKMKDAFTAAAANQFGSGWAWLIKKDNGELMVTSSPNQDNPLMDISPVKGKPILCIDVWEHAYYLKYQNRRIDFINAFWNIVNWDYVAELYKEK